MQAAGKIAQVGKSAAKPTFCSYDAHIVPHDMPNGSPILGNESRVIVMLIARVFPIGYFQEYFLVKMLNFLKVS